MSLKDRLAGFRRIVECVCHCQSESPVMSCTACSLYFHFFIFRMQSLSLEIILKACSPCQGPWNRHHFKECKSLMILFVLVKQSMKGSDRSPKGKPELVLPESLSSWQCSQPRSSHPASVGHACFNLHRFPPAELGGQRVVRPASLAYLE